MQQYGTGLKSEFHPRVSSTINCKGRLIDLSIPKVMGILNLTPDSFYDGGKYGNERSIIAQVGKMLAAGATIIDVGAYSSRPGADTLSAEAELQRILPAVKSIVKEFPEALLSIDTFRSTVARHCLDSGAALINDISAGKLDDQMLSTVAQFGAPYIMMHLRGTPQTMLQYTDYGDLLQDILFYFSERIAEARAAGLHDLIIDPGFGFSKTLDQNYHLLQNLDLFQTAGLPFLAGISRKSMLYRVLGGGPKEALNGTTALNMVALAKGASLLRVHDVKEAMECVALSERLRDPQF